jgi:hypothetical protein
MKDCFRRTTRAVLAAALLIWIPETGLCQKPSCAYDRSMPTLKSARTSFRITNYECAEMELKDLLSRDTLGPLDKADAHALLAAVYYAQERKEDEKRRMVVAEFRAVFTTYRDWRGTLDIKAPEFADMMEEARRQVEPGTPESSVPAYQATPAAPPGCPSSKAAWIGTAAFVGSATLFVIASSRASDRWDKYEQSVARPKDLYDSYESASHLKQWTGGLTIAGGVVAGYLWWKYFKGKSGCNDSGNYSGLRIYPSRCGVELTLVF